MSTEPCSNESSGSKTCATRSNHVTPTDITPRDSVVKYARSLGFTAVVDPSEKVHVQVGDYPDDDVALVAIINSHAQVDRLRGGDELRRAVAEIAMNHLGWLYAPSVGVTYKRDFTDNTHPHRVEAKLSGRTVAVEGQTTDEVAKKLKDLSLQVMAHMSQDLRGAFAELTGRRPSTLGSHITQSAAHDLLTEVRVYEALNMGNVQYAQDIGVSAPRAEPGYDDQSGEEFEMSDQELRAWYERRH